MERKEEKELKIKREDVGSDSKDILEEIEVEDLTIDGICGVY